MTNLSERELLERAAEVAGKQPYIDGMGVEHKCPYGWNPITSKSDRYELLEAMSAMIDFDYCLVSPVTTYRDFRFIRGDDASQAQAVLEAANAVWESRHAEK